MSDLPGNNCINFTGTIVESSLPIAKADYLQKKISTLAKIVYDPHNGPLHFYTLLEYNVLLSLPDKHHQQKCHKTEVTCPNNLCP